MRHGVGSEPGGYQPAETLLELVEAPLGLCGLLGAVQTGALDVTYVTPERLGALREDGDRSPSLASDSTSVQRSWSLSRCCSMNALPKSSSAPNAVVSATAQADIARGVFAAEREGELMMELEAVRLAAALSR